jgi:hypothetical protein
MASLPLDGGMLEARLNDPREIMGTIAEVWRYPVQSMGGESLAAAGCTGHGILGDRAYGLVDAETGKVVSSSEGRRKWRGIVALRARYPEPPAEAGPAMPVEITLPDGDRLTSGRSDTDERLSAALGSPVHLADKAMENADASYALEPLHVLTTASLRQFARHHPEGRFVPARFRPNLVIDTGASEGFAEQGWIGRRLAIGDSLVIAVTAHCVRCVMTTLPQGDLPFDPAILHTVNQRNGTHAGIYAAVVRPGRVKVGDAVRPAGPI